MSDRGPNPTEPFFLIIADYDRGMFSVEGPMTDDRPWNLAAGREQANLTGHSEMVLSVAVTADGTLAVSGSEDNTMRVWNLTTGRAREHSRHIQCGPTGADRDALASEFQQIHKLAGAPPGSIVRPRG